MGESGLLKRFVSVLASSLVLFAVPGLLGQAKSTASRSADLQIGVGFVSADADYTPKRLRGVAFYTTLDLTSHLGGEFVIHQANSSTGDDLYQRTYEIGPRYVRNYGLFSPYLKAMYGRGVFNFPQNIANLAYNMLAIGAGVDVRILPYVNVRADYEYQDWISFPPQGLTPQVITVGVAYHFPGGLHRGQHY
jgi:opacity protein-like surface antigen